jgi:Rad3-related DNA helicase
VPSSFYSWFYPYLDALERWYRTDAIIAVNQAIGRLIRHKDDFGTLYLLGKKLYQNKHHLSKWAMPREEIFSNLPFRTVQSKTK